MGFGFDQSKCNTKCQLCICRIKQMRNKRTSNLRRSSEAVAGLLADGKIEQAQIRVEAVMREEAILRVYEVLEVYVEMLQTRLPMVQRSKSIPPDMMEAISTLVYSAQRVSDLKELSEIKAQLTSKYGRDYAAEASSDEEASKWQVNHKVARWLSINPPSQSEKRQSLREIAAKYEVPWDTDEAHQPTRRALASPRAPTHKFPEEPDLFGPAVTSPFGDSDQAPYRHGPNESSNGSHEPYSRPPPKTFYGATAHHSQRQQQGAEPHKPFGPFAPAVIGGQDDVDDESASALHFTPEQQQQARNSLQEGGGSLGTSGSNSGVVSYPQPGAESDGVVAYPQAGEPARHHGSEGLDDVNVYDAQSPADFGSQHSQRPMVNVARDSAPQHDTTPHASTPTRLSWDFAAATAAIRQGEPHQSAQNPGNRGTSAAPWHTPSSQSDLPGSAKQASHRQAPRGCDDSSSMPAVPRGLQGQATTTLASKPTSKPKTDRSDSSGLDDDLLARLAALKRS